jgi:hypothetical protein
MSRLALLVVALLVPALAAAAEPVGFGRTAYVGGLRVKPLALLEDSRCPVNALCVWAGRVRIKARIATRSRAVVREMESGKPITVFGGQLTLDAVTPGRDPTRPPRAAYRFSFTFARGT